LGDTHGLACALWGAAAAVLAPGGPARARPLIEESLTLLRQIDDPVNLAWALYWRAGVAAHERDLETLRSTAGELMSLGREIGAAFAVAGAEYALGVIAFQNGDDAATEAHFARSLRRWRELGDEWPLLSVLEYAAGAAYAHGDYERARTCHEESLQIQRRIGARATIGRTLYCLGYVSLRLHRWREAREQFTESLILCPDVGGSLRAARSWVGLAAIAERCGRPDVAARLLGAAGPFWDGSDFYPLPPIHRLDYERIQTAVRGHLDRATFDGAWTEGEAMACEDWEQAVAYALEQATALDVSSQ
jgi:tetratricopeptide (TPR) repeat protein